MAYAAEQADGPHTAGTGIRVVQPAAVAVLDVVDAKQTLRSLAAAHGLQYHRGCGFYQLTRKERVSDSKRLLLEREGSAALLTGPEARFAAGLPPCGSGAVQVEPGQLEPGWTLFVQSTAANRRLLPATRAVFLREEGEAAEGDGED
jgi:hypothetical protein